MELTREPGWQSHLLHPRQGTGHLRGNTLRQEGRARVCGSTECRIVYRIVSCIVGYIANRGAIIHVRETTLRWLVEDAHTNGHSVDAMCWWLEEKGVVAKYVS